MRLQGHGVVVWRVRNASLLCNVRSQMMQRAFDAGCERMLFVDDDIDFNPLDALALLQDAIPADCAVAGGIYPVKGEPRLCAWGFEGKFTLGDPGFLPATHVGCGFMMITRAAFDALQDLPKVYDAELWYRPYFLPQVAEFMGHPVILGEDYAFCEELRRRGKQVYVATGPLLGHVGEYSWFVQDSMRSVQGRLSPRGPATIDASFGDTKEPEPNAQNG
jgi:hypothetical protein